MSEEIVMFLVGVAVTAAAGYIIAKLGRVKGYLAIRSIVRLCSSAQELTPDNVDEILESIQDFLERVLPETERKKLASDLAREARRRSR